MWRFIRNNGVTGGLYTKMEPSPAQSIRLPLLVS